MSRVTSRPRPAFRPTLELLEDRLVPTVLPPGFTETPLTGTLARPTAMEFAPDGRLFVAEQGGTLRVYQNDTLLSTPFVTLSVDSSGERGLLGVAFDPNFTTNHSVYVYYTVPGSPAHNRVSRFTANGNVAVPGSEVPIVDLDPLSTAINHNGGAIHFGLDGKLYLGVGDNANSANSQSLGTRLGKLLRVNPDGSTPADNPFVGVATGLNQEIWALGLRNPFTFAINPVTGRIFINDVGLSTWEEIDGGVAGGNYGWPVHEGPSNDPGYIAPLFAYPHTGDPNQSGIAITGGTFYQPAVSQFPSAYQGEYFFSDYGNGWIRVYDPTTGAVSGFATGTSPGTVDLKVGPDGGLYYLNQGSGSGGAVYEIRSTASTTTSQVRFASSSLAVGEDSGLVTVTVLRTGNPGVPATVSYSTSNGTAAAGVDYTATSGTLTFAPYQRTAAFSVPVLRGTPYGGTKTFTLTLAATDSATLASPATAVVSIAGSGSFVNQAERFVAQAYLDLLGRPVDAGGMTSWTALLAGGGSPGQVIAGIVHSTEYETREVSQLYTTLLGRTVDASGLSFWVNYLSAGGTVQQVRAGLLGSTEYFQATGGTQAGFLAALYEDALARPVDASGLAFMQQLLTADPSRQAAVAAVVTSLESAQDRVASFYQNYLRRAPDAGGLAGWSALLDNGTREEDVLAAILGSAEYYGRA